MSKSQQPRKKYTSKENVRRNANKKTASKRRHGQTEWPAAQEERTAAQTKRSATPSKRSAPQVERTAAQTEHTANPSKRSAPQVERTAAQTEPATPSKLPDAQTKQSATKETISLIISAILGIPTFIDIRDKPSISFKVICYILFIISLTYGFLIRYRWRKKIATTDRAAIDIKFGLLWGLMFLGGILSLVNFSSQIVEKENTSQNIEHTEQQLLAQAELHYNGNQYESLIELYTSELLTDNPIALNNLGYMYSNGVYFSQNFDTAIHYYELASAKGSSDAVHNLIALKLHNCTTFEEVVEVLNAGYQSGDNETFLFLGSILRGKELSNTEITDQIRDNLRKEIDSFFTVDAETQAKILSESLGPWKNSSQIVTASTYGGNDFIRYILISSGYNRTGMHSVFLNTYLKSTRTFLYDHFMQERFVSVIDS